MNINNSANTSSIVSKVWAFCKTLRDDGVGHGDKMKESIIQSLQQAEAPRNVFKKGVLGKINLTV